MDLYKELFEKMQCDISEAEKLSYWMLSEICKIIRDDSLEDDVCFEKIEKIVCLFEKMGIDAGNRHDFG